MENEQKKTLTEIWIQRFKNNPIVAVLIITSLVIAGISTFTESACKLYHLIISPQKQVIEPKEMTKAYDGRSYNVVIKTLPVTSNYDASVKPGNVRLELHCGNETQILETLNFPISKLFVWSPKKCGDTVLTIDIGDCEIQKKYLGPLGFPEFLREFHEGNRVFRFNEFSDKDAKVLQRYGIDFISISYLPSGADPVKEYLSK
jgi:type VI secretion system protein ImpL